MNKSNPSDLLQSWSSTPGRANILVAAPGGASYVAPILALGEGDKPYEVVQVEGASDAMRLMRRAQFAVLVLEGRPAEPGFADLLICGLAKEIPPQVLVISDGAPAPKENPGLIRVVAPDLPGFRMCEQVFRAAKDFGQRAVFPAELLGAVSGFPDDYWLRISEPGGGNSDLCIEGGRAVYCEVAKLSGDAAVRHILGWGACAYEFREYPAFLRPNMNRLLVELLQPGALESAAAPPTRTEATQPESRPAMKQVVWQMPAAVSEKVAAPEKAPRPQQPARDVQFRPDESEIEEPVDIPVLHAARQESASAPPTQQYIAREWTDDPEEPVFDPTLPEPEIVVEEPLELFMDEEAAGFDEPSLPEFSGMDMGVPRYGDSYLGSEVFASFAVLGAGGWELEVCYPPGAEFDPVLLKDLFARAIDCAERHGLGSVKRTVVSAGEATLALAQAPGTERLLVVRTRDRFFGQLEESELMRLLEAVAVTAPTASV